MVSVIIPVYNCAELLPRMMECLQAQTFRDFETVLVDDGSTDGSLEVCRGYESERVRVVAKSNGGPASARNCGLEHCSPESRYVVFVDSDDAVAADYLEVLMQSPEADFVVAGFEHVYGNGARVPAREFGSATQFSELAGNARFAAAMERGALCAVWGKRFKRALIEDGVGGALRFADMRVLEDSDFVFRYVQRCRDVVFLPDVPYKYIHRPGSETSSSPDGTIERYMELHGRMLGWFGTECGRAVDRFVFHQYYGLLLRQVRARRYAAVRRYLRSDMVRRAFASYSSRSRGEAVLLALLRMRMLRTLHIFISR